MPNLIEQIGASYFTDSCRGSWFLHDDKVMEIREAGSRDVACFELRPVDNGHVDRTPIRVPADAFEGWGKLAYPRMGYRSAEQGKVLVFATRRAGSYHRGLSNGNMTWAFTGVSNWALEQRLLDGDKFYQHPQLLGRLMMKPEYTPFRDGVNAMRDGDILSFALNADFAVVPSSAERELGKLMFRENVVGHVTRSGELVTSFNLNFNTEN